jgi:hypothetical protein
LEIKISDFDEKRKKMSSKHEIIRSSEIDEEEKY